MSDKSEKGRTEGRRGGLLTKVKNGNPSSPLLNLPTPTLHSLWMTSARQESQVSPRKTELSPPLLYVCSPISLPHPLLCLLSPSPPSSLCLCWCGSMCNLIQEVPGEESVAACDLLHTYQTGSWTFLLEPELKLIKKVFWLKFSSTRTLDMVSL